MENLRNEESRIELSTIAKQMLTSGQLTPESQNVLLNGNVVEVKEFLSVVNNIIYNDSLLLNNINGIDLVILGIYQQQLERDDLTIDLRRDICNAMAKISEEGKKTAKKISQENTKKTTAIVGVLGTVLVAVISIVSMGRIRVR